MRTYSGRMEATDIRELMNLSAESSRTGTALTGVIRELITTLQQLRKTSLHEEGYARNYVKLSNSIETLRKELEKSTARFDSGISAAQLDRLREEIATLSPKIVVTENLGIGGGRKNALSTSEAVISQIESLLTTFEDIEKRSNSEIIERLTQGKSEGATLTKAIGIEESGTLLENMEGFSNALRNALMDLRKEREMESEGWDKRWALYEEHLIKNGFLSGYESEDMRSREMDESYASVKEKVERLETALAYRNDRYLDTVETPSELKRWGKLEEGTLSGGAYRDLTEELRKWQERLYMLGALIGIKGETSMLQTQINKKAKYIEKATDEETRAKEAAEAMREYLKQYGTYQQQKLAIAEEYAEKIKKAESEGEKKTLEAERDSALRGVEQKALSQKIDWQTVFGDLTGVLGDQLKETLNQLMVYTKTDEFRARSDTDKQTIYEAIDKFRGAISGGEGTLNFGELITRMKALGAAVSRCQEAELQQEEAYAALKSAQDEYRRSIAEGTDEEKSAAASRLAAAQQAADAADEAYNAASTDMQNLGNEYRIVSEDTIGGLNSVATGLQGFASGSLQGEFQGLQNMLNGLSKLNIGGKVGDAIDKLSEKLSSGGFIGQLISAILSILDVLKDGIGPIISGLIDTILSAVSGILDNILSGDFVVQIGKSLVDGISGIFDALTWGGFSSWFDTSNAKEVQATIDRLTERNELLTTAIEDLTDEIKASKGTKSVAAYKQAYENQQETNENYLNIAKTQAGYHGAHHSWNYYWDGFSEDQLAWIRQNVRSDFDGDIWSLSPEEMKQLRSNVEIWESIQNTGDGGYGGRLTEKLDDYIDQAGKLEKLTDELYEGLTGISFDSMYDSFIDNLMDMEYSAEDAADDISEYFMRAMLSNKIGELYSEKLEEWWKKFGEAMEDNDLTEAERTALAEEYMGYVNEAIALRDSLSEATGYTGDSSGTSQTGKSGSFTTMTQDQGTKLEGMFTSGLQHWSSMDTRMEDVSAKMDMAEGHLAKIEENTGVSASHLNEIKEDLKKVIRDGLKVK